MSCINASKGSLRHPYTSLESKIAAGVMCTLAIFGTVLIFCYRSRVNRPCSVTFLWIIIDLAILSYVVSLSVAQHVTTHNKDNSIYELGF